MQGSTHTLLQNYQRLISLRIFYTLKILVALCKVLYQTIATPHFFHRRMIASIHNYANEYTKNMYIQNLNNLHINQNTSYVINIFPPHTLCNCGAPVIHTHITYNPILCLYYIVYVFNRAFNNYINTLHTQHLTMPEFCT